MNLRQRAAHEINKRFSDEILAPDAGVELTVSAMPRDKSTGTDCDEEMLIWLSMSQTPDSREERPSLYVCKPNGARRIAYLLNLLADLIDGGRHEHSRAPTP